MEVTDDINVTIQSALPRIRNQYCRLMREQNFSWAGRRRSLHLANQLLNLQTELQEISGFALNSEGALVLTSEEHNSSEIVRPELHRPIRQIHRLLAGSWRNARNLHGRLAAFEDGIQAPFETAEEDDEDIESLEAEMEDENTDPDSLIDEIMRE